MNDRSLRNISASEAARRLARNRRLVVMIGALAGIIAGLLVVPYVR